MTESFIAQVDGQAASGAVTLTIPSCNGGDVAILAVNTNTTGITVGAGWTQIGTLQTPASGVTQGLWRKVMAGSVGSASSDVGTTVACTPGGSVKSSATMTIWRGVDNTNPVNAFTYLPIVPGSGQTDFTGPAVASTVDNCEIVSIFMSKNSTNPWTITPPTPAGWAGRSDGTYPGTVTGKADCYQASLLATTAGNYGAVDWQTTGQPGAVGIWSVALAPFVATTDLHPTTDISHTTNVVGVGDPSNLYANIDETTVNWTDWNEMPAGDSFRVKTAGGTDPGVDTGASVFYDVGFSSGAATATIEVSLYQNTTLIEQWADTYTADQTSRVHNLNPTNVANITDYTNLRLDFSATSVA